MELGREWSQKSKKSTHIPICPGSGPLTLVFLRYSLFFLVQLSASPSFSTSFSISLLTAAAAPRRKYTTAQRRLLFYLLFQVGKFRTKEDRADAELRQLLGSDISDVESIHGTLPWRRQRKDGKLLRLFLILILSRSFVFSTFFFRSCHIDDSAHFYTRSLRQNFYVWEATTPLLFRFQQLISLFALSVLW